MMLRWSRRAFQWKVVHRNASGTLSTARRPHSSTTNGVSGAAGDIDDDGGMSLIRPVVKRKNANILFTRRQRARIFLGNAWLSGLGSGTSYSLGSSGARRAFSSSLTVQEEEKSFSLSSSPSSPSQVGTEQDGGGWIDISGTASSSGGTVADTATTSAVTTVAGDGVAEAGSAVAVTLGHWPSDYILRILDMTHSAIGLEWWQSIIFVTIAMRATMFPLALTAIRNSKNTQLAQPEMLKLKNRYDEIPAAQKTQEAQLAFAREMKALYAKYDFSPFRSLSPMLIQIPVFMGMFFGLKRLGDVYPSAIEGGAMWFPNLMANDSTFALPILTGVTMLITTELGFREQAESQQNATARTVLRALSASMPVIAAWMPCGVLLYWTTTNVFSLFQSSLFAMTPVRAALGIREVPSEVLAETAKIQASGKKGEQPGVGELMSKLLKQQQDQPKAPAPTGTGASTSPMEGQAEGSTTREGALSASAPLRQGSGSGMNPLVPGMPMNFDPNAVHKGKGKKGKGKKGKR